MNKLLSPEFLFGKGKKKQRDKGLGPGKAVFSYRHPTIHDHFSSNLPNKQTNICVRRVKTCFRKLIILLQLLSIFCLYGFYRLLIYNASKKQLKWLGTKVDLLDLLSSKVGIDSSDFQVILWSSPRPSSWPFPFPYLHKWFTKLFKIHYPLLMCRRYSNLYL